MMAQVASDKPPEKQRAIVQAVMEGLADINSGIEMTLNEVKKRPDLLALDKYRND